MKTPGVLHEDDSLLILDKPSGWVVNRSQTVKEETLQDWLEKNFHFETLESKLYRDGIVHRLDKETSGVLVVAKTPEAFGDLQNQFKERRVEKTYLALVHGKILSQEGIVRAPISRSPYDRKRFGIFLGGKEAETIFKVIDVFSHPKLKEEFTLLELHPKTGRTHQIRVHLKYLNHPVVSDEFYAGRKTARRDRQWCPRHFLHAAAISFFHPKEKRKVTFSSPLPDDLKSVLEYLKNEKT